MTYNWDNDYGFNQTLVTIWLFLNLTQNQSSSPLNVSGFYSLVFGNAMYNSVKWYSKYFPNPNTSLCTTSSCNNFYNSVLTQPIPGLSPKTFQTLNGDYSGSDLLAIQNILSTPYSDTSLINQINSITTNGLDCYKNSCYMGKIPEAFWNLFYSMYQYDKNTGSLTNVANAITSFNNQTFSDSYLKAVSLYINTSATGSAQTLVNISNPINTSALKQFFSFDDIKINGFSLFTALLGRVAYEEFNWTGWDQGYITTTSQSPSQTPPALPGYSQYDCTCYRSCSCKPPTEDFWECQ